MGNWPVQSWDGDFKYAFEAAACSQQLGATGTGSSGAFPAANRAIYMPVVIRWPTTIRRFWWSNGASVTGNVDVGLYTMDGKLLASTGSTAQSGINSIQGVDLGTPLYVTPGAYYLALASSSTGAFLRSITGATVNLLRCYGVAQESSAFPLPATFTLEALAAVYIPVFGYATLAGMP